MGQRRFVSQAFSRFSRPTVLLLPYSIEKGHPKVAFFNSGGRIRTSDLRVMSPTSYQAALPRDLYSF